MSFFTGGITYCRLRVNGPKPTLFNEQYLSQLERFAVGRSEEWVPHLPIDGVNLGWCAGRHVLDRDFSFEKNVVNDFLFFSLVGEAHKIPAERMRSYYETDLAALVKDMRSGIATARMKREAKASATDRIQQEAADGRFLRRQAVEVLWDRRTNELLFASASPNAAKRLRFLFKQTFGHEPTAITVSDIARDWAADSNVEAATPTPFLPQSPDCTAWVPDSGSRDWLGNEFLLWLWYQCDDESATIVLPDATEATVFMSHTLALECPAGRSGKETITHEGPTRLPEALRAIQSGKLPRKAGLTVVRHDVQYQLTLHAETFAVTGARIPPPDEEGLNARGRLDARVDQIRELRATIDQLFGAFCEARFEDDWPDATARIRRWLTREEVSR